ncbi:hypothetical protein SAVIM40S_04292 [Streptomyces avidinii]
MILPTTSVMSSPMATCAGVQMSVGTMPARAWRSACPSKISKRFLTVKASCGVSSGTTSSFQTRLVSSLSGVTTARSSASKPSQGLTQPGWQATAASRCSKAAARATRLPPMLRPVIAIRPLSTSLRVSSQSTIGPTTFSQRVVKGISSTNSSCPWPGPS